MNRSGLIKLLEDSSTFWKNRIPEDLPLIKFIYDRLKHPSPFIAFMGETSSGKSTLLNALAGRAILPTGIMPTTGTVTAIHCRTNGETEYRALFRDAASESISPEQFRQCAICPPEDLLRLDVSIPTETLPANWTLVDTPGFDSVISQHTEILWEFLPEADAVAYVVNYDQGIGVGHLEYLRKIGEILCRDTDVPIFLLVNCVPQGADDTDARIREIQSIVGDALHRHPDMVTIGIATEDRPLNIDALRDYICHLLSDEQREHLLTRHLTEAIAEIVSRRMESVRQQVAASYSPLEVIPEIDRTLSELPARTASYRTEITKRFSALEQLLRLSVPQEVAGMSERLTDEITKASKLSGPKPAQTYIQNHLLPIETDKIQEWLMDQFQKTQDRLSDDLEDWIKAGCVGVETVLMKDSSGAIRQALPIVGGMAKRVMRHAAVKYIAGMGGNGQFYAGIGNFAKHAVKAVADKVLHKKLSRGTYTFIGKLCAKANVKLVGAAFAVVAEFGMLGYEIITWKKKLRKEIDKTLATWQESILDGIHSCCLQNITENQKVLDEVSRSFEEDLKQQRHAAECGFESSEVKQLTVDLNTLQKILSALV